MHGAGGGAPLANRNAYKHGYYGAAAIAERKALRLLGSEALTMLRGIRKY